MVTQFSFASCWYKNKKRLTSKQAEVAMGGRKLSVGMMEPGTQPMFLFIGKFQFTSLKTWGNLSNVESGIKYLGIKIEGTLFGLKGFAGIFDNDPMFTIGFGL